MRIVKLGSAMLLALGLAACASPDTASRNASFPARAVAPGTTPLDVQMVRVSVPPSLKVSEANRYYPGGDIVWREDGPGDRHAQVQAILEDAFARGTASLPKGSVPVVLDVELSRFHALSEKARYTIGGVHAIQFTYVLRDPATGAALTPPKFVKADFRALGGQAAIEAERNGITQKRRITEHLAQVIHQELGDETGYHARSLGVLGAINQI